MASRGKSAREVQEEVERALHHRRTGTRRRMLDLARWVLIVVLVPAVLVGLLWAGLVGLHFSKGASLGNAISMTADDARVATSCPAKPRVILDFLGRSETVPMGKVLSPEEITLTVQLVCDETS